MNFWISAIFRFFALGPLGLIAISIAVAGGGYYVQQMENSSAMRRAAAFEAGPPQAVKIEEYREGRDKVAQSEVNIRAQLDFAMKYELTQEERGADKIGYMIPLVAVDASYANTNSTDPEVLGAVLYTGAGFEFGDVDQFSLLAEAEAIGDFGPILTLNGFERGFGDLGDVAGKAFEERGREIAANAPVVHPFINGREAAFRLPTPGDAGTFALFLKIAGGIALLALFKFTLRTNPPAEAKTETPEFEPTAGVTPEFEPVDPVLAASRAYEAKQKLSADVAPPEAEVSPVGNAVPLWKQRVAEKQGNAPVKSAAPQMETPVLTKPGLSAKALAFRAIFGVVLVSFVLMLGITIYGLLEAQEEPVAVVLTPQELLAQALAEVVAPVTAKEDKAIWDVDFAPVVQWVVAKASLAAMGDPEAIFTLSWMVAGGIFFLILLRVMIMTWVLRRGRRTRHNFSDLMTS